MTGKYRDVKGWERKEMAKIYSFPCGPLPWRSNNICIITLSQHWLFAGPKNTPMHSWSSCASPPPLHGSSWLAPCSPTTPLSPQTLTHLHRPESDYKTVAGRRKARKESKKKRRNCLENNCTLTPCSDSSGSALTRTAGIPSSINILLLRLPVNEYRGGVRRVI